VERSQGLKRRAGRADLGRDGVMGGVAVRVKRGRDSGSGACGWGGLQCYGEGQGRVCVAGEMR
jgi:hypothetical protein